MNINIVNSDKQFQIDEEDFEKLCSHNTKFRLSNSGRVMVWSKLKHDYFLVSRVIMNSPKDNGYDVDHINHDIFDNRKANLRFVNFNQGLMNRRKTVGKFISRYKGVTWDKDRNKWMAKTTLKYKTIFLGRFNDEIMAAIAYDDAVILRYGEYALLNFQLYGA